MPKTTDKNLDKLQRLLTLMDTEGLTRSEFSKAFQKVIDFVLKNQSQLGQGMAQLKAMQDKMLREIANVSDKSLKELKGQVNSIFVGDTIKKFEQEHKTRGDVTNKAIQGLLSRTAKITNGTDGTPGLKGDAGSPDTPGEVRNKLEKLEGENRLKAEFISGIEELIKEMLRMALSKVSLGGRGPGNTPHNLFQVFDASSQADGFKRVFVGLPSARHYPMVFLRGQNPVTLLDGVDYTIGANSMTLDNSIEPPQENVGIYIAYVK